MINKREYNTIKALKLRNKGLSKLKYIDYVFDRDSVYHKFYCKIDAKNTDKTLDRAMTSIDNYCFKNDIEETNISIHIQKSNNEGIQFNGYNTIITISTDFDRDLDMELRALKHLNPYKIDEGRKKAEQVFNNLKNSITNEEDIQIKDISHIINPHFKTLNEQEFNFRLKDSYVIGHGRYTRYHKGDENTLIGIKVSNEFATQHLYKISIDFLNSLPY
tara:strand:- start:17158 stop:17811 length:654 start_codon:yes stop_codon:yes gene_type:complete